MATQTDENNQEHPGPDYERPAAWERFSEGVQTAKALHSAESGASDVGHGEPLEQEEAGVNGLATPKPWETDTSKGRKKNNKSKSTSRKKRLAILGAGGGSIIAIGVAIFLQLFQLNGVIDTVMNQTSAFGTYALSERVEYLMTRYVATRVLAISKGDIDSKLVFCKNKGIACSLASTKYANWFDEQFELKSATSSDKTSKVTITPKGRNNLGGNAKSWDIEFTHLDSEEGVIRTISKNIDNQPEMKRVIKSMVKRAHPTNFMARFFSKKNLMRRYGVTNFAATKKLEDAKEKFSPTKMRAKITANTLGKVMPKTTAYFACLGDTGAIKCEKSIAEMSGNLDSKLKSLEEKAGKASGAEKEALEKKIASTKAAQEALGKIATGTFSKGVTSVAKEAITKVAGPVAVLGVLDMVFSVLENVEEGTLETIVYDVKKTAYTGYAFGDEYGVVPNADKLRYGGLDLNLLGQYVEMVQTASAAPLYNLRNGTLKYDAKTSYTAYCEDADGIPQKIALEPGELVCPEQKMVVDFTKTFVQSPFIAPLTAVAKVWNSSVGQVFDIFNAVTGAVIEPIVSAMLQVPGIKDVANLGSDLMGKGLYWLLDTIFGFPKLGETTKNSASNYVALDAAISAVNNEAMSLGVEDGEVYGGGGQALTNDQVTSLSRVITEENQEDFKSYGAFARVFDINLSGSMMNRLAMVAPTNLASIMPLPSKLSLAFDSVMSSIAHADSQTAVSPHGMVQYGYPVGSSVFTEDPATYTDSYCEETAKARDNESDSHIVDRNISPIPIYKKSDPCALEKIAVASMLQNAGITDDENSAKEATATSGSGASSSSSSASGSTGELVGDKAYPLPKGSAPENTYTMANGRRHGGVDMPTKSGTPIYSVADGKVVEIVTECSVQNNRHNGCGDTWGNHVKIDHGSGVATNSAHMLPGGVLVKVGDTVKAGQQIGKVGSTGSSSGSHLHFEVYVNGTRIGDTGAFNWLKKYNILPTNQSSLNGG